MSLPPQGPPPQGWPPSPHGGPPQGPPPHWPPPPGQPPYWPPPQGQPWQGPPAGIPPRPPSNNTGLIVGVIAAVAVIGIVLVVAVVGFAGGAGDSVDAVSDEQRAANAKTADLLSEFDVVCGKGSVSNAATYEKPYRIVAFSEGDRDGSWDEVTLDSDADYYASPAAVDSVNVVACLSRKAGTEVKSGTCEFTEGSVDHYAVEYEIQLREAKTGKSITSLGSVSGPADDCPFMVFLSGDSDKIYGEPDDGAVAAKLAEFAS